MNLSYKVPVGKPKRTKNAVLCSFSACFLVNICTWCRINLRLAIIVIYHPMVSWGEACYCHLQLSEANFPGGSDGKEPTGAEGDTGSIPGSGSSSSGEHGNSLQYSCLENPLDRGAWRAAVYSVAKSRTWLNRHSTHACSDTVHSQRSLNQFIASSRFIQKSPHVPSLLLLLM